MNENCNELCDKTNYECVKDLFCKVDGDTCVDKDDNCNITIKKYYNNINETNISDKKSMIDWLDNSNIRKKDLDAHIQFYLIILLFIFLCYLIILLLLGKITIEWSFIQRDFNYIKSRMTTSI